ncbi:MAG TPA: dodecin domain-containing protein [Candidatus Limnocylindria bacterium]|jgi:flavin-binding protein dodecin|nr:dodecin domain-containing protein [Candidatus Limnocylindria bacterium]
MPARRRSTSAAGPAVVRLVDASGDSTKGWDAAVLAAVKAAKVKDPLGVEVGRLWAELEGSRLSRYHASVKVAYRQSQGSAVRRTR